MTTININTQEQYVVGSGVQLITKGINAKCQPVVVKATIEKSEDGFVAITGGIRVRLTEECLKDFYLNTPANRKTLKS